MKKLGKVLWGQISLEMRQSYERKKKINCNIADDGFSAVDIYGDRSRSEEKRR